MKPKETVLKDLCSPCGQLVDIDMKDIPKLPHPYEDWVDEPMKQVTEERRAEVDASLDGVVAARVPVPKTDEERDALVAKFIVGINKLFSKKDNWTFLQPLMLSMENCVKCQSCSDECPTYISSGREEIYRPIFRGEILRRIINKYLKPGGTFYSKLTGSDIDLNWETVARLAELSYRCTLCRRCA